MKMKKLLGVLLALVMLFSLVPAMGLTASADGEVFSLGNFDSSTKTFKDASGTGTAQYKTLMIAYGKTPAANEQLTLPTVSGFAKNSNTSTGTSTVIDMADGKTLPDIAAYVKQIQFNNSEDTHGQTGQEIMITITNQVLDSKVFYYSATRHYYEFVSDPNISWTEAYTKAKNRTYAGRQGYLITITTEGEDRFVHSAANMSAWLGGTSMGLGGKSGQYYTSFDPTDTWNSWRWASGPEIGTDFSYTNWGGDEPTGGGECCLVSFYKYYNGQTVSGSVTGAGYGWNDIKNDFVGFNEYTYVIGYFVEYGDKGAADGWGDSSESSVPAGTITAKGTIAPLPPSYTVSLSGGTNATASGGAVRQSVTQGQYMAAVTYTANTNYAFASFSDDTTNGVTLHWVSAEQVKVSGMPTDNVEITVPDAIRTYTVTTGWNDGGAVSVSCGQPTGHAAAGASITVTATPNPGYEVESITVKYTDNEFTINSGGNFEMPEADVNIDVVFKPVGGGGGDYGGGGDGGVYYGAARGYRVSLAPMTGGSAYIFLSSGEAGTSMSVVPGSLVWIVTTPDPGYEVESIVCMPGGDITGGPSFLMPECDVTVYVTFRPVA